MRILGIETSCDETAVAVVEVKNDRFSVLSNVVASQIKIHAKTGGVVPEVAARAHVDAILPVVKMAMQNAKCKMKNLGSDIDAIAVTAGPGLVTSLLVGVEVARTLAWLWKKPLVAVNHLAGHVYASFLPAHRHSERSEESLIPAMVQRSPRRFTPRDDGFTKFPILALIVSGGHTELVLMRRHLDFKIIGATRDDAAGEAFDKVAKMLGLGYPGGPAISRLAEQHRPVIASVAKQSHVTVKRSPRAFGARNDRLIEFPRPMIDSPDFDFSFSGLKTAVLYYVRDYMQKKHTGKKLTIVSFLPKDILRGVCHEFQQAVVDVLVAKTMRAAKQYKVKTVLLGGGVAANQRLREQLSQAIKKQLPTTHYSLPTLTYTTDNAAMIAAAGYFMARAKQFTPWQKLDVDPNWELGPVRGRGRSSASYL